jgi:diacylglycerol kinase family enzyme
VEEKEFLQFEEGILKNLRDTRLFGQDPFHVDLILCPKAGYFKKRTVLRTKLEAFEGDSRISQGEDHRTSSGRFTYSAYVTRYAGHASELGEDILNQLKNSPRGKKRIIVTAGGDATHRELITPFIQADPSILDDTIFFRLPMGTGNDGSDVSSLEEVYSVLRSGGRIGKVGVLIVKPKGLPPLVSLNITSIGLDAYITYLTNRMKMVFSGEIYRIFTNLGILFYNPGYGVHPMKIKLERESGTEIIENRVLLAAFGISGRRTYGGGMKVLPGDENLCVINKISVLKEALLKKRLFEGSHIELPFISTHSFTRAIIEYDKKIPIQLDGDAIWLDKSNFPVEVEVMPPFLQVLQNS